MNSIPILTIILPDEAEEEEDATLAVYAEGERAEEPDSIWAPPAGTALFSVMGALRVSGADLPQQVQVVPLTTREERRLTREFRRAWDDEDWDEPRQYVRLSPELTTIQQKIGRLWIGSPLHERRAA